MDEALDARLKNITGQALRALVHEQGVFRRKGKLPPTEAFDRAAITLRGALRFCASRSTRKAQHDNLRQHADAVETLLKFYALPADCADWPASPFVVELKRELELVKKDLFVAALSDLPLPEGQPKHRREWREIAWGLSDVFDQLVGHETCGITAEGPRARFIAAVIPWVTEENPTEENPSAGNVANHLKETKNVKR